MLGAKYYSILFCKINSELAKYTNNYNDNKSQNNNYVIAKILRNHHSRNFNN